MKNLVCVFAHPDDEAFSPSGFIAKEALRRMIKQEELEIPYEYRFSHAISTKTALRTQQMTEEQWKRFFNDLKFQLKRDYPESYENMFPEG